MSDKAKSYARHRDISDWIYANKGKFVRNLDGQTELNDKPVTRQDILAIYNEMRQKFRDVVLSRIEDILAPSYSDYRYGPHVPFAETGYLRGEPCAIYKVWRQPNNEYCIRTIKGPMISTSEFGKRYETIDLFNAHMKLNGITLEITSDDLKSQTGIKF